MAKLLPFDIADMRSMSLETQAEIADKIRSLPPSPEREEMIGATEHLQKLWRAASDTFILDFFLAACFPELENDFRPLGITRADFEDLRPGA